MLCNGKSAKKLIFFCVAILHPLLVKVFKSETTSFHNFSPKDSESLKFWTSNFWKWGPKTFKRYLKKWTNGQTHGRTDKSTYRLNRPRGPIQWWLHFSLELNWSKLAVKPLCGGYDPSQARAWVLFFAMAFAVGWRPWPCGHPFARWWISNE